MRLPSGSPTKVTAANTAANADKATVLNDSGIITSSPLTTAIGVDYTLSVSCPMADQSGDGSSMVFASVRNGSNSAGSPSLRSIQIAQGLVTIVVRNIDAANPLNGTLITSFVVFQ